MANGSSPTRTDGRIKAGLSNPVKHWDVRIGEPRVLVAGTPLAIETLRRVAGGEVEIVAASSVDEALTRLNTGPDAIVCSVRFNESRMFDFLVRLRAMPQATEVPVICCRTLDAPLSAARYRAIALAAEALGAAVFIDMHTARRAHGGAAAEALLRRAVMAACRARLARVQENVLAAVCRRNEAKALCGVEKFQSACNAHRSGPSGMALLASP